MPFENEEYFDCKTWRQSKGKCLCQSESMMQSCLYFTPSFGTDFLCMCLDRNDFVGCTYKRNEDK